MVGRIRDSYANPRWSRGFAQLSRILPTPRVVISGYANTGKKFSIAFIKYFSKLIRQMKGILFIDLLIQTDFLNTRSRQWSFLLTNQNAHLITHEPMNQSRHIIVIIILLLLLPSSSSLLLLYFCCCCYYYYYYYYY